MARLSSVREVSAVWVAVWLVGAASLMAAVQESNATSTVLGIQGTQFTLNGKLTFLYGISYYGALAAPEEIIRKDLDDIQRYGFNWMRVWANWRGFGAEASAVDEKGQTIAPGMEKLKWLVAECNRRGLVVDVTLSRGNGISGAPRLQTLETHRRAVESIVAALKPLPNWYLDLSNERNIQDKRFTSFDDLKELRESVRRLDRARLVTASQGGDISRDEVNQYLQHARMDFITPHRPRHQGTAAETEAKTREYLAWVKESGRVAPVHYQEPFRRGYGKWDPPATEFILDARNAKRSGAAGWCFHNGDQRDRPEGIPRRSFDLRETRLFEQLDPEERKAVEALKETFGHSK